MTVIDRLNPWVRRPFELILHAEIHHRRSSDYDRRLSLISFDNSIEVSITTYLTLNPIQRNNSQYRKEDVTKWLNNYHSKLDFLVDEIARRAIPMAWEKAAIVWYHDQRNELYHGSSSGVPEESTLRDIREVALWVFSVLFDMPDIEKRLSDAVSERDTNVPSIPIGFATPDTTTPDSSAVNSDQGNALVALSLLGGWDEGNAGDMEVVKELVDGL
jgi:hypothetical protein